MPKESLFPETISSSSFLNDSFVYLIIIIIPETESDSLSISLHFQETYEEIPPCHLQTYLLNAVLSWQYKQMFISHQAYAIQTIHPDPELHQFYTRMF